MQMQIFKSHKRMVVLCIILMAISISSMTMLNMWIADLFHAAQIKDYILLLRLFLLMFIWYIVTRLVDYWADITSVFLINDIRKDIKRNLFKNYINQNMENFSVKDAGRYVADFTNDLTMIESKCLLSYKELARSILTIAAGNIAILTINYKLNIILIAGIIICLLIPSIMMKRTTKPMNKFILSFEYFVQQLKDYFGSFFAIKSFGAEEYIFKKFKEKNNNIEYQKLDAEITIDFVNSLIGRIAWFIEYAVISVGIIEVIKGKMDVSVLFSAYLIVGEVCMPLQLISGYINNIKSVSGILEKSIASQSKDEKTYDSFEVIENMDVQFDHFTLKKDSRTILNDICIEFKPKKKYLIVGKNGSGKSTLAKALKKIYNEYDGNIYINQRELHSISEKDFDKIVIYTNETVSVFSDNVKNNITLFRDISENDMLKALKVSRFKNPMDYMIVDKGRNLSSGEKRKLELARALLTNTPIMVFDEVISTLDIETAYEIENLILSLDKTVIMISNAFSGELLTKYDEIILIDNGRIINHGTHEYMLDNCEKYRDIYHVRCEL